MTQLLHGKRHRFHLEIGDGADRGLGRAEEEGVQPRGAEGGKEWGVLAAGTLLVERLWCYRDQEGRADALITGDKHLLVLGSYEGVAIMTPHDFVERFGA